MQTNTTFLTDTENLSNGNSLLFQAAENDIQQLFNALDTDKTGVVTLQQLLKRLSEMGIQKDDPRLNGSFSAYLNSEESPEKIILNLNDFVKLLQSGSAQLIKNAIKAEFVIPDFKQFTKDIQKIYEHTKTITGGHVATYIPQLSRVNPDLYAISICTIDGQKFQLGDHRHFFVYNRFANPSIIASPSKSTARKKCINTSGANRAVLVSTVWF